MLRHLMAALFALLIVLLAPLQTWAADDDIARLYTFSAGQIIQSSQINNEYNQIITTLNGKMSRAGANTISGTNTFSGNVTFSGQNTFSNATAPIKTDKILEYTSTAGVTIDGTLIKDNGITATGTSSFSAATTFSHSSGVTTDTITERTAANGVAVDGLTIKDGVPVGFEKFRGSSPPVYATAATFTVAGIYEVSSALDGLIRKTTSTTVDISTTGLNGVAQSANLTGTIAVTNGSPTVTGSSTAFTTDFQAGDVICVNDTSQCRRITNVGGATTITVESNFTSTDASSAYKRGGEAPNTWYNLYAMTDGSTPGLILSTRNVIGGDTLVDLPTGYTKSKQLLFAVRNDGSSNLLPWYLGGGWPYRPVVMWDLTFDDAGSNTTEVVSGGTQITTFSAAVSCASFVPPISKAAMFHVYNSGAANRSAYIKANGSSNNGLFISAPQVGATVTPPLPLDSSQQIQYKLNAATAHDISVAGWIATEGN